MVDGQADANSPVEVDDGTKGLSSTANVEAGIEDLDISRIDKIYK